MTTEHESFRHALGARLKEQRDMLGLSQADAAERCGVRREQWGKYERGAAVPGADVIERFVIAGADPWFLFKGQSVADHSMAKVREMGPVFVGNVARRIAESLEARGLTPAKYAIEVTESGVPRFASRVTLLALEGALKLPRPGTGVDLGQALQALADGIAIGEESRFFRDPPEGAGA